MFDKQLERLRGPEFLRKAIRNYVMGVVDDQLKLLERPVDFSSGHHRVRDFSQTLAAHILDTANGSSTTRCPATCRSGARRSGSR